MKKGLDFYAVQEEVYLNNTRLLLARVSYSESREKKADDSLSVEGTIRVNQFEGIDALKTLKDNGNHLHILIYSLLQQRVQKDFEGFKVTGISVSLPDNKGIQHTHIHFKAKEVLLWDRSPARVKRGMRWTFKGFRKLAKECIKWT